MTYEQASQLAQTGGLVLLTALFAASLIYALWPGNADKFKRASRAPLDDGDDHG
jgi:cytochrome c oxidase cbb3-type subunit 4